VNEDQKPPGVEGTRKRRRMFISTRRQFLGLASGLVGAAAISAQQSRRSSLPANRISPLDGIKREGIRITDIKVINLAYKLKPEEQWADGDENTIKIGRAHV
jgi:hypothetical protein